LTLKRILDIIILKIWKEYIKLKKVIMFIGTPGMNNMELAHYLQITKYSKSIIIDRYDI
jgi:hypothetical protein